jgi:hypothetical protein
MGYLVFNKGWAAYKKYDDTFVEFSHCNPKPSSVKIREKLFDVLNPTARSATSKHH